MAKIEIKDSPDELGRIAYFLSSNNIKFKVVKDYGNHSTEDAKAYAALIAKFEEVAL
ncbi:hypothetical protein [Aggregatimonas sangjinii]|uniref:hypothetical protein n=1 Tax=Aggregatimonas sangjinii TaxID=2583587 RepID=UPI001586B2BA|nr:hypothetical protein [Aggregatimonas sangjinii]